MNRSQGLNASQAINLSRRSGQFCGTKRAPIIARRQNSRISKGDIGLRVNITFTILAAITPLWAQQQALEQTDTTVFRTDTRLVVLHATPEDKDGKMVMDLPQSAFQVFENGIKQDMKGFRQED